MLMLVIGVSGTGSLSRGFDGVGRQPGWSINHCGLARVTIADICRSPLEPSHQAARVLIEGLEAEQASNNHWPAPRWTLSHV
jgi:hypothetical protein